MGLEPVFSVSEFLEYLNLALGKVRAVVQGEISEFKMHPKGVYFSLKDSKGEGVLSCYLPLWRHRILGAHLEDGLEVRLTGVPNVFARTGRLSFVVEGVELVGEGSLEKAYEALKRELTAAGIFGRKRELPKFIRRVGVLTSRTGAVIHDLLNNLEHFGFEVSLYDVRVEGREAVSDILRGLAWFASRSEQFDVLVVMRGGGSLQDLQAFDNEAVARAIFASPVPTVAAIGHHRDVTIAALTADQEVSTPTAAAELLNSSWDSLREGLPILTERLINSFENNLSNLENELNHSAAVLSHYLDRAKDRLAEYARVMLVGLENGLKTFGARVSQAEKIIQAVNPEHNLRLGYGIIFSESGKVVRSARDVKEGDIVRTRLHKGEIKARVEEGIE